MKKLFTLLSFTSLIGFSFAQSNIPVGATCPNFTVTTVDGQTLNLHDICDAGQYVIVDFFAYWCGPCQQTAPTIHSFYTKYGCNTGDVFVLGIESDANSTLADLANFKAAAGLPSSSFPNVLGSAGGNTVMGTYGISAYPTIILIGPDRKMINNDIWPISGVATLENAFPANAISEMSCATASLTQDAATASISLYPNPATDVLNIAVDFIQSITITDASGKMVFTSNFNNLDQVEVSVSDFESGIYVVTVTSVSGVISSRFVK